MTAKNAVAFRFAMVAAAILYSLTINAQLSANFSATPLSGCSPLIVSFTDQSTGNPTQWQWTLGNATSSTAQNPATTYFNPGTYTVKLVIKNAAGDADSITKLQYITVNAKPTVTFSATPLTGCFPLPVDFTSQSVAGSGTITSWQWDLGDGNFSSLENPSHIYTAAGNYNVSLKVTNSFGCFTSVTKPQYIQVGTGVHADFTNNQPANCDLPSTIQFQDASTGSGVLTYQWFFGDGGTSTLTNPAHTYLTAGNYTVKLIVTNSTGCTDTIIKTNAVSIGIVHAAFIHTSPVCEGSPVTFTNTSTPAPTSVVWTFGDATGSAIVSPTKTYAAPGTYNVKMLAFFGACKDSITIPVTVFAKPTAAFIGGPQLSSCGVPLTVDFTNQSTNGVSYAWDFGDGNTSTLSNPSHTYTTFGTFTVKLTTTNAAGCTDVFTRSAYITIQAPVATINGLPIKDCSPLTHTFTATVNTIDPVVSYLWDFGDGNTSTLASPTHTFATGVYDITLIIKTAGGCSDTVKVVAGITASTKPHPAFSASPRDACARTPINFSDLSTGTVTQWLWNFGDGGTSTNQNPVHVYEDTGYFDIQLIVWNEGCPDTLKIANYIHIKPPIAKFIMNFNCKDHFTKIFTDQSIGADEWNWDFGDGNTSTTQSPTHTYASPGTYTVTLLVRNTTTGCDYTKTTTLQVVDEHAAFTQSQTIICRNTAVDFAATGVTDVNIASYKWTFGDGGTATTKAPSHVYTTSGTYTVRLIITDVLGCKDTLTKPLLIRVDGPVAGFTPVAAGNCTQATSVFTDHSTSDGIHAIVKWTWNFGDGNIVDFTSPPFTHNYATPGLYNVSLLVTDSKGCTDTYTINSAITISKPIAAFTTPDTVSCPGKPVTFTNASTGPALTYNWNFGDGSPTSTATNPVHNYSADGIYTVTLSILDQYGCSDITTKPITIGTPHANFSMSDSVSTCPPLIVAFTNTSINTTGGVTWDFGDGTSTQSDNPSHFYSYPGTYNVKLHVTSPGGCVNDIVKQVIISGPQGSFTYAPLSGCSPLTVTYTATTLNRQSFVWDYNDGNILPTNDSVVTHIYAAPGNFVPKMILVDAGGCQVPITGIDTIKVSGVTAKFGFNSPILCDNGFVSFTDSSTGTNPIADYKWYFGDGDSAIVQNPTHHYLAPGIYYPSLAVTSVIGCTDTVRMTTPVKVVASPQASIINSPNGCAPITVTFSGSVVADTSAVTWMWDFGNGVTSTLQNPPAQTYASAAAYNISLVVTNSSGCKDIVDTTVEAYIVPTVSAGLDTMVCRGSGVTLHGTGADTYTWSPPGSLSCNNCANPVASPIGLTAYEVIGTTIHGCTNKDSVLVNVTQPFTMRQSVGDTLCKGSSIRLFASGAATYAWSPSTGLNSTTSPTPTASPSVTTIYRVIGTDAKGCFNDTAFVPVKVYPYPTVNAGADKTINVGQSVTLTATVSSDAISAIWTPTLGIVSYAFPSVTVKPAETTAYLVEVKNEGGCKARSNVTVFVLCNGANIFIPNTFSPNGDGANDIFFPRGTGLFSVKTFRIFNRWGEVVFEKGGFKANDAAAGWDGTYKGVKLPPDVFVYTMEVLCDNNTTLVLKGNIALIR